MSNTQNIKIKSEIDHLRSKPTMYIGSVDSPRRLIGEIIDNALDESLNGHSSRTIIETGSDDLGDFYKVTDFGRGLPLNRIGSGTQILLKGELVEGEDIAAKLIFIKLFSSGKFDKENYEISAGTHGIGLTAVNALCESLQIITESKGFRYELNLSKGEVVSESLIEKEVQTSFTTIVAYPDKTIFGSTKCQLDERSLQLAKVEIPNCSITVNGEEVQPLKFTDIFQEPLLYPKEFTCEFKASDLAEIPNSCRGLRFKVHWNWSKDQFDNRNAGSVNLISVNRGVHCKVGRQVICKALSQLLTDRQPRDFELGLRYYVSSFLPDTAFSSQSKEDLTKSNSLTSLSAKIQESVYSVCKKLDWSVIDAKIRLYREMTNKLSSMELIKEVVKKGAGKVPNRNLGIGMYDCNSRDRKDTELFIVEGDSAAGGLVKMRDRKTQAILPLKGKVLNVGASSDLKRILGNAEIKSLVNCIGVGLREMEDTECRRYDRIIIFADADADGLNIAGLLLGAFGYLFPKLLAGGFVYMLKNPLYAQGGKFIYEESELNRRKPFDRFKGLGELDPDQLALIALDAKTRTLIQLKVDEDYEIEDLINLVSNAQPKRELMESKNLI